MIERAMGRMFGSFLGRQMTMRRSQLDELPVPPGAVLFIGDSITEQGQWEEWFPSILTVNRGVGGDTVEGVLERIERAIREPVVVSILAGTNNLGGVRGTRKPAEIASLMGDILDRVAAGAPDATILLTSVMPRHAKYAGLVRDLNERYRQLAADAGAQYIDVWPVFSDDRGGLRADFTSDGLHLNGLGYRAWTSHLRPHIEAAAGEQGYA